MCIATPAKVLSVNRDNHTALVDVMGNRLTISVRLIMPQEGDYVLLHAGYAVEILKQDAAREMEEILRSLDALAAETVEGETP